MSLTNLNIVNSKFREQIFGVEDLEDPSRPKTDPNHVFIKQNYTRYWNDVTKLINDLLPVVRQKLEQGDSKDLVLLTYGLTSAGITDRNLLHQVQERTYETLKANSDVNLSDDELILGVHGLAELPFSNSKTQIIMNYLKPSVDQIDVTELDLNSKLRLLWSLSTLDHFDLKIVGELVDDLNTMPFQNARNELHYEELMMLKDIYFAFQHLNVQNDLKLTNDRVRMIAKNLTKVAEDFPETKAQVDPFKSKIVNGLGKLISLLKSHI